MLHCCEDAVTKLEYSCRVAILPVAVMAECNSQGFVDERAIIVHLQWVLWSQRARSRITRYLQISRWQFGGESSAILKFMAVRVEARRDGLFFFFFPCNDSTKCHFDRPGKTTRLSVKGMLTLFSYILTSG